MANIVIALAIGLLFALVVVGFGVLGGTQGDVGYAPYEDVGADDIDMGYDDYDIENTFMESVMPLWEINSPQISFRS